MGLFIGDQADYYEGTDHGNYQFVTHKDIVNNFMMTYVGEGKLIPKIKRTNVVFHARRAIQEFTYDIFRSLKTQEIEIPPHLWMILPHDYVAYQKVAWVDDNGIERTLFPARKSSNPKAILQDEDYIYLFDDLDGDILYAETSETWKRFKASTDGTRNNEDSDISDYEYIDTTGGRYGLDPEYSQNNGLFFIDNEYGKIFFDSTMTGKVITLSYISDGLAEDAEMLVHKLAEEAVYMHILYAVLNSMRDIPEYVINRFKKRRFAEMKKAKIRLSQIKIEELTQLMRGKSKRLKS
jgi:hypothetical protein